MYTKLPLEPNIEHVPLLPAHPREFAQVLVFWGHGARLSANNQAMLLHRWDGLIGLEEESCELVLISSEYYDENLRVSTPQVWPRSRGYSGIIIIRSSGFAQRVGIFRNLPLNMWAEAKPKLEFIFLIQFFTVTRKLQMFMFLDLSCSMQILYSVGNAV